MADWQYRFGEIAKYVKKILGEISQLDSRLKNLENAKRDTHEPKVPYGGTGSPFSPFVFFASKVTTLSTASFGGLKQMPSDADGWVADDRLTTPITVVLGEGSVLPDVDDIVLANFTGSFGGAFDPLYGCFDHDREIEQVSGIPDIIPRVRSLEFDTTLFEVTCVGSWRAYVSMPTSTTTSETTTTTSSTTTQSPETIDIAICGMFNLCGEHISFPQKRLSIPANLGIVISDIDPTIVSLTVCEGTTTTTSTTSGTTTTTTSTTSGTTTTTTTTTTTSTSTSTSTSTTESTTSG